MSWSASVEQALLDEIERCDRYLEVEIEYKGADSARRFRGPNSQSEACDKRANGKEITNESGLYEVTEADSFFLLSAWSPSRRCVSLTKLCLFGQHENETSSSVAYANITCSTFGSHGVEPNLSLSSASRACGRTAQCGSD
jgi:hypothetical protein